MRCPRQGVAFHVVKQPVHIVKVSRDVVRVSSRMIPQVVALPMHQIVGVLGVLHQLIHFTVGVLVSWIVLVAVVHFPTNVFRDFIQVGGQ